jgi:hypothetical protein
MPVSADRLRTIDEDDEDDWVMNDLLEWDEVGYLGDGHYFGEQVPPRHALSKLVCKNEVYQRQIMHFSQALFYEAPRIKRYRSYHAMATVATLDKDDIDMIMEDYESMSLAVKRFAKAKHAKLVARLRYVTGHHHITIAELISVDLAHHKLTNRTQDLNTQVCTAAHTATCTLRDRDNTRCADA